MKKSEYDLVVSLGGNCAVATQLTWRNMRPFALGLDWTLMPGTRPISYLTRAFENGFDDFALKENLHDVSALYPETYTSPAYRDDATGFELLHQFRKRAADTTWYDDDGPRLKRRIARMVSEVSASKRVLFVLATGFPYDDALAMELSKSIRAAFPKVTCDFRFMMFAAGVNDIVENEDGVCVQRIARSISSYDLHKTSVEWEFLDYIEVTRCRYPALKGLNKLRYKVWKHLGKKLKRLGASLNYVFK